MRIRHWLASLYCNRTTRRATTRLRRLGLRVDQSSRRGVEILEERSLLAATLSATLDGSNNLVIEDTSGSAANQLTISRIGADLVITDSNEQFAASAIGGASLSNSDKTITIPVASVTGTKVLINGQGGSDQLTVDLSTDLGFDVQYAGGAGTTDSLVINGGTVTSVTHTLVNANDGSVSVVTGTTRNISYTGLEPVTDNLSATDRVFDFTGGAETISLTDAAGSNMTVDSTLSESITFANPSNSLTINAGTGDDTVNLSSFDAAFNATLNVNGDAGTDSVNVNASLALTGSKGAAIDADNINVGAFTISTVDGNQSYTGAISVSGSTLSTSGTGVITLGGNVTVNGTAASNINGLLNLNSATRTFTVNDVVTGDDLVVGAATSGGGLVKAGEGTMLLSGTNSYTGATGISDGILALSNNNALGSTTGVTATATATGGVGIRGSRVELRNVTIAGVPLVLNSTLAGDLRSGLIADTIGTNTWTGQVTVQGDGTTYFAAGDVLGETLIVSGNLVGVGFTGTHKLRAMLVTGLGAGTMNGTINLGTGSLFKDDDNNWTINSTGNSWGITQLARGSLTLGANNALATGARLQMGDTGPVNSKLILNGFNQQLGSVVQVVANTGTARIVNGSATAATFTIDTTMTATFTGIIGGPGANENNLSIVKQGSGSQTLTSNNTYFGTTTINAGILGTGSNSGNIGDGSVTNTLIFNGGTLLMGGFVSPSTRAVQFLTDGIIQDGGANNTIQGQITGAGGLVKQQNGVLTLSNATNTFGGVGKSITLQAGTISVPADTSLGDSNNSIVFAAGDPTLRATASFATSRPVTLTSNGRFDATGAAVMTVNGLISGTGQLSMGSVGANGTIVLANGSNSYTGATHVDFGTLQVTTNGALGTTGAGTDASSLTVIDFPNVNYTSAELIQLNNATLRVSSGTTTLAGPVQFNAGTPTVNVAGTALTLNGVVSGSQNVNKTGSGSLTMSANNTFTGTMTASAGSVFINGTNAGGFTMQTGTTLGGTGSTTGAVTMQSGSTLSPGSPTSIMGTGNLSLSSGSTYSVNLNGTVAGTQYDQLNVTGSVSLGNATLSLNVGYAPNNNDTFVLIQNDGVDAVSGTFNGLAEGATIIIGPNAYILTYQGGTGNDVVLRADTVGPSVQAFARQTPLNQNTNADSLVFRVTFSEAVLNVDATDFVVNGGTTATITSIGVVSTSQYDLTVSGGNLASFNGTVGIDLAMTQNITDTASQALAGTEPAIDETYIVDNIPPSTTSFTLQNPGTTNTNADVLIFLVTFSEPVINVDSTDFIVTGPTGTVSVSQVTPSTYTVTISGGNTPTFNGTVALNYHPTENITDLAGNALPTTEPATDQSFSLDNVAPSTTSFTRFDPVTENTTADSLVFRATFNEPVENVNVTDFVVNSTTTATITSVTQFSTSIYEITVSGGDLATFTGTVGINFDASQNIADVAGNLLSLTEPTIDETYNVDNNLPSVLSFTRFNPATSPTNADTLVFQALFSEPVTNITAADFVLDTTSTATITGFSALSSSLYEITVSGGDLASFNGTVGLDLDAAQDITDLAGNVLPTLEPLTDEIYVVDNTTPTTASFTRFNPATSPTSADTLIFRATFDEDVQNVSTADFTVNGGTTAAVTNVTPVSGSVYNVTVSGGDLASFNGTVGIDFAVGQNITDLAGIALPTVEPAIDETYVVDNQVPTTASFTRFNPADENTSADTLIFRATFSEGVLNVSTGDFVVNGTTTATVTAVSVVSGSVYNVTVSGGNLATFNGVVGINFSGTQNITDLAGNALTTAEPLIDETYTVDNSDPSVTSFTRFNPATSPTNADTLIFLAEFSEDVQNVGAADFTVDSTTTATITSVNQVSPSLYEVTISGGDLASFNGTVGLDLDAAQDITDLAGNVLPTLEPLTDEIYVVDNTTPMTASFTRFNPATSPTSADTLIFRATFDEDVQNVSTADFTVNGGTSATVTNVTPVSGSVYNVTVSGGDLASFNGTVGIDFAVGQNITDLAGIALPTVEPAIDETYVVDNQVPTTASFTRFNPADENTSADTLIFRATFSEGVLNVSTGDFVVNGTTTATVTAVSVVSSSVYNVTVSGGDLATYNGVVGINFSGTQNITDLAGNALTTAEPLIDETYTVDNSDPSVTSFTRFNPATSPTNADTLIFLAEFSEDVQNVGTADFTVDSTTTATITAVNQVSPSLYEVTVSGGDLASFNGTVGLDLDAAQDITDLAGNVLPTLEPLTDEIYVVDNTTPTTASFTRFNPATSPTSANTLIFLATFDEDVQNVSTADFTVNGGTTATVTSVTPVSGSVYEVTVSGGNLSAFNGTVGIDFAVGQNITDLSVNALPTTEPAIDETYLLDNAPPSTLSFVRFIPLSLETNADSLIFRATFSEDMLNVSAADFVVDSTTTATVTAVSQVTPSTYDITISGGDLSSFNGTVGLDLSATQDITDIANTPLPTVEPAIDEIYIVDNTAATTTSFTRFNPATSPTNADMLVFRAIFDEPVLNVGVGDFVVDGTTTATVTAVTMINSTTYNVTVSGGDLASFNGVVGIDFDAAQDITDIAGNALPTLEPAIDETYLVDNTTPTTASFTRFNPATATTNADTLIFRATFSEDVQNVGMADVVVNSTSTATVTAVSAVSGSIYEVTVSGGDLASFNGTVGIDFAATQDITDLGGNALPTIEPATDEVYAVDNIDPELLSFTRFNPASSPTNADTLIFRATFNEAVSNVGIADFVVNSTTTATVTAVSAVTSSLYEITVSGGDLATFDGLVGLDLAATQDITDIGGTGLPTTEPVIDETYLVDNVAPVANSFTRFIPATSPTAATTLTFRVEFDTAVTNVSTGDFVVDGTTTATVTAVAPVSSTLYEVTISGGDLATFSGTVGLDFDASQNITDLAGNPLPTLEPAIDETYVLDNAAPSLSIERFNPATSPTNLDSLTFRATFNESVLNADATDFVVTGTTATITGFVPAGGNAYDVTVSGGDLAGLNGTVGLNLAVTQNITDLVLNALPTVEPTIDETYVVDNSAPTVDITDITPDPRFAPVSTITIVFNEPVVGLTLSDLNLSLNAGPNLLTGGETLSTLDNITWTLTGINLLTTPDGSYDITLTAAPSITDIAGNALTVGASDVWTTLPATYDMGDAPDTYGTSLAANGPIHFGTGLLLGTSRDNEGDASLPLNGTGDDVTNLDDEDGSVILAPLVRFGSSAIQVTLSAPGFLDAWIDLDSNGMFDDPTERFGLFGLGSAGSLALPTGTTTIPFNVPSYVTNVLTTTYARFRLSSSGGYAPIDLLGGFSPDGEVEDQVGQFIPAPAYVQVDDDYAGATPGDILDGGMFGVDRFDTFAQALLVVADNGTVGVKPGTYPENVVVAKNVLIDGISGNAGDVIIDPPGNASSGIFIGNAAINVEFNDLSVTDSCHGIESLTTGTLTLTNVDSSNNACDGLNAVGASLVSIVDSTFNGNGEDGIDFNSATGDIEIATSSALNNVLQGITVSAADDVTVSDGTFSGILIRNTDQFETSIGPVVSTKPIDVETQNATLLNANVDSGANTIRFAANLDSAGSQSFEMQSGVELRTTNDTPNAVRITVNTLLGGTGNVLLGEILAGPSGGSLGGRITVSAASGAILDNNGVTNNLAAGNAILTAANGVGTLADSIDSEVSNIEGSGGSGGFFLDNYGALTIGDITGAAGITTTTGDIRVIAHSPLTVAANVIGGGFIFLHAGETAGTGDDLTVETGVTVRSTGDNVDLEAGDDIYLEAGSIIESLTGSIFIKGDCANADALGSFISIDGLINSALGALVNGDTDADEILVNAMGTGGLLLDGLGNDDEYRINYPDLPTTFGSPITVNDSIGGVDRVSVFGTNDPDTLFLTTDNPPTTATTEQVSRGAVGSEAIVLHDNIEQLDVYLLDAIDIMHAQPSMLFPVFLDGGEPCFGDPGVPPGDQLVFDPLGNTFNISGITIQTDGGAPDPFFGVDFVNFESLPLAPLGAPPGGALLLDFNHTNTASTVVYSPTQSGYLGVNQDTLYSGGLGYGWQFPVKSFERDDGFYDNTYSDLTRDGHWLEAAATFTVDLPNGWYLVSAMVGNPYTSISGASIKNGDTLSTFVPNIVTGPGESKHFAFPALVTDGTLDLQFVHATAYPTVFAVNGISIRPANLLTMGLDCQTGSLDADGVTVDSFTLFEAPPNSFITVATTLGTIMNPDVDDELQGIQIQTNALGQATILVRRPTGAGTAIVTFEEVTGAATGVSAISYVFPSSRRFDFNHVNLTSSTAQSPTQTPVASILDPNGFQGVPQTTLYNAATGFGWIASPHGFDLGGPTNSQGESIPDPDPLGNLRRDGALDTIGRTFRVDLPNGTYRYQATIGYDHDIDGMQINVNGSIISDISVAAGERAQISGTFTVVGGVANFAFSDQYGPAPNWVINGLEIRPEVVITPIVFAPNFGASPADGLTITPITASTTLSDGEQVTVSTTLGTIITPDVNSTIDGIQVFVSSGQIFFEVKAPTIPGTPTFTATSLDGSHRGTINDAAFLDYEIAAQRRFDFNHTRSNSSTGPSNTAFTFYGVVRTDIDRINDGFGWNLPPHSYDNYVPNEFDNTTFPQLTTDLYSDWASGHVTTGGRTFSVQAKPGASYDLTVYLGSGCHDTSTIVTVEGIALPQSLNLGAGHYDFLQFFGAFDADMDGYIEILFDSTGAISNFWATNGLDIVETPAPLPLPAPLMGTTRGDGFGVDPLTEEELAAVVVQAINVWAVHGVTGEQLEILQSAQFVIRDLGDNAGLAWVDGNGVINIDDNGAGHGWSLQPDQPAGDRYDLLTAVAHELGHLLGLEDLDPHSAGDELMNAFLGLGERHDVLSGIDGFFESQN